MIDFFEVPKVGCRRVRNLMTSLRYLPQTTFSKVHRMLVHELAAIIIVFLIVGSSVLWLAIHLIDTYAF